jgi:fumarate reductase flavoprotein subunit
MKQLEADVAIVAGGTAGLAAAVAAREGGASVIVFEKSAHTGGAANIGNGPFAVESRLQRQRMYTLSKEEAYKIHMEYTHWRVNARLVWEYYNRAADTIDWLEKMGVEFREINAHTPGAHYTFHIVKGEREGTKNGPTGAGVHMMRILAARAKELGAQILLKTPVKSIIHENGNIKGVVAVDESGEEIRVMAPSVIIATGGFCDNPEWIKKYTGYEQMKDIHVGVIKGVVGDGIRMAWEVGAAATLMTPQFGLVLGINPAGYRFNHIVSEANLKVNLRGERFVNEDELNPGFVANALSLQKKRTGFTIIDEVIKQSYVDNLLSMGGPSTVSDFDAELEQLIDRGAEIFIADSLEELARKTGIDPDGLSKTVAEYNKACETGRDEIFHRNPRNLIPVKQPRFYAFRLALGAYGTLGGIKINHRTEVVNEEDEVIPGLYAAGNDANSIYADSYIYPLPGNTMGFALNTGRIAGENAAKYVSGKA